MLQTVSNEPRNLGQILSQARTRRGLTQEELGKDAGLGQAAVAKIERNQIVPKVTTLSRYLRALGLTPEEDLEVWQLIRGNVEEIDWAGRLGLTGYKTARDKALAKLARGDIYDAYGYIEAMVQLAETREQKAYSQLLHGNRFKDLGFVHLAERYYNQATSTLGREGDTVLMNKVLVNLADLHAEVGHSVLGEACVDYVLRNNPVASTRAFCFLVKGKLAAASGTPEGRAAALVAFEQAQKIYEAEVKDSMRTNGEAWLRLLTAEVRSFDANEKVAREAMSTIKDLRDSSGPAAAPTNPELHVRASLVLAERQGDPQALGSAQRVAQRLGFSGLITRVRPLGSPVVKWLMMALLVLGGITPSAQAAPPPGYDPEVQMTTVHGTWAWITQGVDEMLAYMSVVMDLEASLDPHRLDAKPASLTTNEVSFSENSPDPDDRF